MIFGNGAKITNGGGYFTCSDVAFGSTVAFDTLPSTDTVLLACTATTKPSTMPSIVDQPAYGLKFDSDNLKIFERTKVAVGSTETITATTADAAIYNCVANITDTDAKAAGQADVVKLVATETTSGSGQWSVSVAIDESKMATGRKIADTATSWVLAAGNAVTITIPNDTESTVRFFRVAASLLNK